MSVDLDRLERLAAEATPGPWAWLPGDTDGPGFRFGGKNALSESGYAYAVPDAEFIAACDPETILALTRAVRAALVYLDADDQDELLAEFFNDWIAACAPFRGSVAAAEDAG